jgi:hypothetical protein
VGSGYVDGASRYLVFLTRTGPEGRSATADRRWAGRPHASKSPTGVQGDPWAGPPHASRAPTGSRPATPLCLGRHEDSSDEQCPTPDKAEGDVAAFTTRMRCAVARLRRGRRDDRRGSLRADAGIGLLTADLHDDRPALGVRELVTDEDLTVLVLVGGVAADLDRVLAPLSTCTTSLL